MFCMNVPHDTDPIPEQGAYLRSVVAGYTRYYGVPLNSA